MAFKGNLEKLTRDNNYYRRVISTTKQTQLVLQSLMPGEEIGFEMHPRTSQFFRVEGGTGTAHIGRERFLLRDGDGLLVPAGTRHNIIAGSNGLKFYTLYSPPQHRPGLRQRYRPLDD